MRHVVPLFLLTLTAAHAQSTAPLPPEARVTQVTPSGRGAQAGSVTATATPVPGLTTSVNALNPAVLESGAFAGSVAGSPFDGRLSLRDALTRALSYNLGLIDTQAAVRLAHGQEVIARAPLLPNLNGNLAENVQQSDLKALGLKFSAPIPGFNIPTVVGPFNFFQLQASLTQTVANWTDLHNYRSSQATLRANKLVLDDARQQVALAVAGAYLQVIAAKARLASAQANLETANTLYQQSVQQQSAGTNAQLDVDQNHVQSLTQQLQLQTLTADLAKQKINLARISGLPPSDQFDITDNVPYAPAPQLTVEQALQQAYSLRADLKAAQVQVGAAEQARAAASAERLPSAAIGANYGVIGTNPGESHGVFAVTGSVQVPLWQGGRTAGDIEVADATLAQRKAELVDLRRGIEADIREAMLDLQAAATQVDVARQNVQVSQEALDKTRLRAESGVINTLELVKAQQLVASAQLDYISSVFAHNVAKLALARAMGEAADNLQDFLKLP